MRISRCQVSELKTDTNVHVISLSKLLKLINELK